MIDQLVALYDKGSKGEIYHIGIDKEITIKSLIKEIARILDIEVSCSQLLLNRAEPLDVALTSQRLSH